MSNNDEVPSVGGRVTATHQHITTKGVVEEFFDDIRLILVKNEVEIPRDISEVNLPAEPPFMRLLGG